MRRRRIRTRIAGLAALILILGCARETERASPGPNVIVYLVDTLRQDHLSVYGYPLETSPRLAEFARDAVRFETAYSPTSWTRPAVASLLSGLTPERHGAVSRPDRIAPEVRLLPEYLDDVGYHSRAFVANPQVLPVWGFGRGFDTVHDVRGARGVARADEINEAVFESLRDDRAEPFFLYVHTVDPHFPYAAPRRFRGSFPRPPAHEFDSANPKVAERAQLADMIAAYDDELLFTDHCFGELVDFLRSEGLYDEAVVIFTSDHGEEFHDHGKLGHGLSLFQEVVQVPLLVKLPRGEHAGHVVRAPASLLDVLPTILGLTGGEPAASGEGVDLVELLRAEQRGGAEARPLFFDLDLSGVADRRNVVSGVMWGAYKLLDVGEPRPRVLLFDLLADPLERESLTLQRAALATSLGQRLAEHRAASEAGVHLWLVNENDERSRSLEGSLLTSGRFTALRKLQLEATDEVRVSSDARRLDFRFELRNLPNPIREPPRRLVDHDRLVFAVEPPDARVELESLTIDGSPAPVFLGAGARRADVPITLDPVSPELRVVRMTTLFPANEAASSVAPLGAYVGVVQRTPDAVVVLDPAVEERLRALGYAD